jgi:hypothetical protein
MKIVFKGHNLSIIGGFRKVLGKNMSRGTSYFGCVATVVTYGSTDLTDAVPFFTLSRTNLIQTKIQKASTSYHHGFLDWTQ